MGGLGAGGAEAAWDLEPATTFARPCVRRARGDGLADNLERGGEPEAVTAAALDAVARRLKQAQAHLANAERELTVDKNGRAILARLVDAVSTTPAERSVAAAKAALEQCRAEAAAMARAWLEQRPQALLAADRSASPWSAAQALRHLDLLLLLPRMRQWQALAVEAVDVMERGAARCRPVADSEFHQQAWAIAIPSRLSLGISELARECIADAIDAAQRLRAVLPEEELSVDLDGLDDVFRRLIAYLLQPVFLADGWRDINKHEQVADKLALMAQMLRPLSIYLGQLADRAEKDIAAGQQQAEAFLAPYRAAARDEMPKGLRSGA